jgi:predicted secreted protein
MKLAHIGILLFFPIGFLTISGCPKTTGNSSSQTINLIETDNGKTLTISKGQEFTLTLPNRVDGGYRFDKEQYDTTILRLQKHIKKPPAANSGLGSPGTGLWQFISIKNGETTLKITASRPWTKSGTITAFENTVIVK